MAVRLELVAVVASLALCVIACGAPSPDESAAPEDRVAGSPAEAEAAALTRARRAADALTAELVSTLAGELSRGGPVEALKVCSEMAPEIVVRHSVEGLSVRRVSLRLRNPDDAPDEYERRALEELEAEHGRGALPPERFEVVEEGDGRRLRYLRPIVVKGTCLSCHGEAERIDPEIRAILEERYPGDEAVGYREGDFRGAVSVTVDLS